MTINEQQNTMQNDATNAPLEESFDIFLRNHLQQKKIYLQDDNFTAQVMATLPAAKSLSRWQERLIMLVPLLVISILVLSQQSLLAFLIRSWVLLSVISVENLFKITLEASIVILMGASYWLAKQYRWL